MSGRGRARGEGRVAREGGSLSEYCLRISRQRPVTLLIGTRPSSGVWVACGAHGRVWIGGSTGVLC